MTPERKQVSSEGEQPGSVLMQLMRSMGATSFDPIPPDQYLTYQDPTYPPDIRAAAWLLSKTIRHGHRSRYAVDERGNELHIEHMAADLGMDPGNARRAWRKLELEGRLRKEGRRLCPIGKFSLVSKANKKRSKVRTDLFELPFYRRQLNRLAPDRQVELKARYEFQDKLAEKFLAEAVAGSRSIFDQRKDTVLLEFGIKKIHEKKRRTSESVLLPVLLPVVEEFVQTFSELVRTSRRPLYKAPNGSVQTPASLCVSELQRTTEGELSSSSLLLAKLLRERVHGNFDDDAARQLLKDCQTSCKDLDPPVTPEEIVGCAEAKAAQLFSRGRSENIRNPIGLLLTAVPKAISGWLGEFRAYRARTQGGYQ